MGNILTTLNHASRQTLETAKVCDARFYRTYAANPKNSLIAIYWLQDHPSVDGVRLLWADGSQKDFPISEDAKRENEEDAAQVVVYNASFPVAHGSPDEKELESKPEPTLVLLKDGSAISQPRTCDGLWTAARLNGGKRSRNGDAASFQ